MDRSTTRTAVRGRQIQRLNSPQSSTFVLQRGDITGGPVLYAETVDVTPEVMTGGAVDVGITAVNERRTVTPLNPAYCDTGGAVSPDGLGIYIEVEPSWTNGDSTTSCLGPAGITPTKEDFAFDYEAPSEAGTYFVDVTITEDTDGSDPVGGTERYEVSITEDETERRPGDGGDDPEDGEGVDCPPIAKSLGICGDGDGGTSLLGTEQVIALAAFSLLVVVGLGVTR